MIPISNFYTGTNAGVVLPDTPKTDRAIKDYYDKQFEISKMQLAQAERNQKMFLDFNKVEPMKALTQKQQAEDLMDITEFQNQMKDVYSKPGGATTVDYMKAQNAMSVLKSKQNLRQSNNELYLKELNIISQNPDEYDVDYWGENQRQYFNDSTKYNTGLVPKKIDLGLLASKAASYGKPAKSDQTITTQQGDKTLYDKNEAYDVTDQQMESNYKAMVLNDYKAYNTAIREFAELPLEKQQEYHDKADANNDGQLDSKEKANAIMLASIDLHKDKFNKVIYVAAGTKPTGSPKGMIISFGIGGGKHKNYMNPGKTTGSFIKDVDGINFVQSNVKENQISSDGLYAEEGVELPADILVKPNYAADGRVEFSVKGSSGEIKKYKVVDDGSKQTFTKSEINKMKISDASIKTEPAGKADRDGREQSVFYVYTTPSKVAAFGELNKYIDLISDSSTDDGVLDKELILKTAGQGQTQPSATTPTNNWDKYKRK